MEFAPFLWTALVPALRKGCTGPCISDSTWPRAMDSICSCLFEQELGLHFNWTELITAPQTELDPVICTQTPWTLHFLGQCLFMPCGLHLSLPFEQDIVPTLQASLEPGTL